MTHKGVEYDYDELIAKEIADAREMAWCLQKPSEERGECFPMDKIDDGLIQWWGATAAFEKRFKRVDPWLQILYEMKNHPPPNRWVTADILAIAVGVEPSEIPPNPADTTAAS